jgi:H+/Cl- antiporter ClcA
MAYDAHKRNIIGTLGFFILGVMIGGFASMMAIVREWLQYKENGVLEQGDLWRYVFASSLGAVIQMVVLLIIIARLWLN